MGWIAEAALARSDAAECSGALVPLATERLALPSAEPFVVRRLLSATPKHLRRCGPKPNPFLPWEVALEVQTLGTSHVVLLNKYPVQRGHLLLITQQFQPQAGWLQRQDWQALAAVEADSAGLWFFNSCAAAGASQPHRHLQLLPRAPGEPSCPLAGDLLDQLRAHCSETDPVGHCAAPAWPWSYQLSRRRHARGPHAAAELETLYHQHGQQLGLGDPTRQPAPRSAYNLLFDQHWFLTVLRRQEHWAGFSINALGFAGYLLATEGSDLSWLQGHGPLALLQQVAEGQH